MTGRPPRPCQLALLVKGAYLPPAYLEHVSGLRRGTREYQLAVMSLIESIRRERPDLAAHAKQERDGVRIMLDLEASHYDHDRRRILVRQLSRSAKRRASIDRSSFSSEDAIDAENEDRIAASVAVSASKAVRAARRKKLFDG